MTLRHGVSRYEIVVDNPQNVQRGIAAAELDGAKIAAPPLSIPFHGVENRRLAQPRR